MAKLPERVVSKEGKNRLGSQLTGQNRRSRDYPVPVLPGAREGRGSLELVEIFQMRPIARRFTPVCRSRCGAGGAGRARGGTRSARNLGQRALCAVLLVQTNRKDTPGRNLGQRAVCVYLARDRMLRGFCLSRSSPGGPRMARARRDLSNAPYSARGHAGLSKSMWRGLGGPRPRRNRVPQGFGPGRRVRGFAYAGQWKRHSRPRPTLPPHPTPPPSLLSVLRTGVLVWLKC